MNGIRLLSGAALLVDYETCPGIPLIAAGERDEGDRQHLPGFDFSILLLFDQHQVLGGMWCADRDHHPAPRFELFDQGGRDMVSGGGHDDPVKGGLFLPPAMAVTDADLDVHVAKPL